MGLLLPGCFIERKCSFSGGEGRLGDEDQSQDLCLSGYKGRGVQGLAQVGRGLGGAPVHLPGTLSKATDPQPR